MVAISRALSTIAMMADTRPRAVTGSIMVGVGMKNRESGAASVMWIKQETYYWNVCLVADSSRTFVFFVDLTVANRSCIFPCERRKP